MWPGLVLGLSRVACCFSNHQQNKTGIFGTFSKVYLMQKNRSLKEYLFSTVVDFYTFTDFAFLRGWSHVKRTFCASYHKPM